MHARDSHDVLIPLVTMNASGGVRMLVHVANELARRGRSVAFVAPGPVVAPPVALGPGVDVLTRPRGRRSRDRLGFVTGLPPARVYVATGYQTPLLIAAGMSVHGRWRPVVHLIQNDEPTSHIRHGTQPAWLKPMLRAVAAAGYRLPARRLAVSSFVAARVGKGRVHRVVTPGIDASFLDPGAVRSHAPEARGGRLTAGILSHPGHAKGMRVALDAFATLRADGNLRLVAFAGANPAPLPDFVERVAPPSGSPVDDAAIAAFYAACDIFVFPSLVEGFGLPPLEAMACGAAVVVTDNGGSREYAENEVNCLIVPPGQSKPIVTAVRRLAADADLRRRLADGGRVSARRFTAARFAAECVDEIEQLL